MTTANALRRIVLGMLCVFVAAAPTASAQETRATVTGTVKDSQGASFPASPSRC